MGAAIRINVYQGDRVELLPTMCMFCGCAIGEEQYQPVQMQIDGALHPLALPICRMDKIPDQPLQPDGRSDPVLGVNPQRYAPYLIGAFGFPNVNPQFAQELERLRNLPYDQYDPQLAQSNERIQSMLQGPTTATSGETDELAFQLEQAAGAGEITRAETRANTRKLIFLTLIAVTVGVLLVTCITAGVAGYLMYTGQRDEARRAQEEQAKKVENLPKETPAKIKIIDRERGSMTVLDKNSKRTTYRIDNATEFFDREGNRLAAGIADPKIQAEEYCVILPTPDRQALQWLKLTPPPK